MIWEHFHVAVPVTDPPPDHSVKLTQRLTKEMRLVMSKEAVVEYLGPSESDREPIPETRSAGAVLLMVGAALGILVGLILDRLAVWFSV